MWHDARTDNRRFALGLLRVGILLAVSGTMTLPLADQHAVASTTPAPDGWSKIQSLPTAFKTRWYFSYAYFPPSDQVVVFGGAPKASGESYHNDTWIYTNNQWTPGPVAPSSLTPRFGAAMGYDPDIGKIVMFGGQTVTGASSWYPSNQTWLYNGSSWSPGPSAPAGLAGRTGSRMAYDAAIHKVVLWGGSGADLYTDTWLFDGTSWTKGPVAPATMSPRQFFGMAYDPNLGKVVLAGGDGATDTWYFDGKAWTKGPSMPTGLGAKELFTLEYDPQLAGLVTFGSLGPGIGTNDMYVLRNDAWIPVSHASSPNGAWPNRRADPAFVYHPMARALMMFAGIDDANGTEGQVGLTDAWFYRDGLTTSTGSPTMNTPISGYGFDSNETVSFKLDSPTAPTLLLAKADGNGWFMRVQVPLPTPLTGGVHIMYAIGATSGLALTGPVTVTPSSTLVPGTLTAGQTTTYEGVGFKRGETVSASFPGGIPKAQVADSTGSVHISLVTPTEPYPGGVVTGVAFSGSSSDTYSVDPTLSGPAEANAGSNITLVVTGYGKSESCQVTLDSTDVIKTFTSGANGAATVTFPLNGTIGRRPMNVKGVTSGQHFSYSIHIMGVMNVSPSSGGPGTAVTVTSGPGWVPNETVHLKWMNQIVKNVTVSSTGMVTTTYTIPSHSPGPVTMRLSDDVLHVTINFTFTVK